MTKIIVDIHESHFGNYLKIQDFLAEIEESSKAKAIALMVVTSFKCMTPLVNQKEFCRWLKEKEEGGEEESKRE